MTHTSRKPLTRRLVLDVSVVDRLMSYKKILPVMLIRLWFLFSGERFDPHVRLRVLLWSHTLLRWRKKKEAAVIDITSNKYTPLMGLNAVVMLNQLCQSD